MAGVSVQLIESMGSDLSVVNAARVSFDKESEWEQEAVWTTDHTEILRVENRLSDRDTKLIAYLAKHEHWSPFAHAFASFRVRAPIFVARQLQKHTVGLAWNEVSRRYVDDEPTFFTPETWRKRAENVKQGSSDEAVTEAEIGRYKKPIKPYVNNAAQASLTLYNQLLEAGVCPEQARMVLPQSMMTQWVWSGSLYAFARVCNLRLDSHTQKETQQVAKLISAEMTNLFPESWKALVNG